MVTGVNFGATAGEANDIDVSLLSLTGGGGATYTLTDSADVELTSLTEFTVALSSTDALYVRGLLHRNGNESGYRTTYNLAAADNWMRCADSGEDISDPADNGITVSNYTPPSITSATFDYSTGVLVVTGVNFGARAGVANDIDVSLLTLTGEGRGAYTLTDSADVDVTSATTFAVVLSSRDTLCVRGLLNKDGIASGSGITYNLAAADNWLTACDSADDISDSVGNGITVSNCIIPTITSATYDANTGVLTVTGTSFARYSGAANDVDVSLLTVTGEGGATYTLSDSSDVEFFSGTSFYVVLSSTDQLHVRGLLNTNGTTSGSGTAYNLIAADNWMRGADANQDIADTAGNGITVSNYSAPMITSATFDHSSGSLVVTGSHFSARAGVANDIDVSLLTVAGGDGGATYTLTDSADVEVSSGTTFFVVLSTTDKLHARGLLNKGGTASGSGTTYNLAAADNWMRGADPDEDISDLTGNGITVSNCVAPTISSATYDADTGQLTVTGMNFFKMPGAANDIDVSLLTVTGEGGTYTLTSHSDVEITSATSFRIILSGADKTNVDALLDQLGTTSTGGTTYSITVADNWLSAADAATDITDAGLNAITVVLVPKITSATYDASMGILVVTGTNIQANGGGSDIDVSNFTVTGEGGATYTLTNTNDVDRTNRSQFTLVLSSTDRAALGTIFNKNGTSSTSGTPYNLAAADCWNSNFTYGNAEDLTGNGITVANVQIPRVTSATYNGDTGTLVVTGAYFTSFVGAANDIDAAKLSITGKRGATHTLSGTSDVDITSSTQFTLSLGSADKAALKGIVNSNGTTSLDGTTYLLSAAEDWARGADEDLDIADTSGNGITALNIESPFTLNVAVTGDGRGTVTSNPAGIRCPTACADAFVGNSSVTLIPSAMDSYSEFAEWSGGGCSGNGPCTLTLVADTTVTASFRLKDSDGDGVPDQNDEFPHDPSETGDHDNDDIGNNADPDDDNDGMSDAWEAKFGLDPLSDDADLDSDGDGLTNFQEYKKGSDPMALTPGPGKAMLISPEDSSGEQAVNLILVAGYAAGGTDSDHAKTRWQVAEDAAFKTEVFHTVSDTNKTRLTLPQYTLKAERTYHWRVRYIDDSNTVWPWSETRAFSTGAGEKVDADGNGIPDEDQVPEGTEVDFDGDGVNDAGNKNLHIMKAVSQNGWMGLEATDQSVSVEALSSTDMADIPDTVNRPLECPLGLYSYRLGVPAPGSTINVTVRFTEPIPEGARWYKYDSVSGWADFSDNAIINADRRSAILTLTDGGDGDADGVANGVIVDPSGPAMAASEGGGGGGCFIGSVR
ncbi:hypothetical protein DSLASN_25870 [Desulfoluna limicola]|uniref:Bacterial repeat domain-containing protein n=1 Tax=Desulfoluna limicola TaxID=2810562 RepID=A0ABN6F5V8_9BACT|nr:hypothetical protein DSLASN_25870 [Desulfoluna limicola]